MKIFASLVFVSFFYCVSAQQHAVVKVNAGEKKAEVRSTLHGVFFEEINHAGEGGLYAELIQNRGFEESRLPQGTILEEGFIIPNRTPHFMMPDNGISDWKLPWPHREGSFPGWELRVNRADADGELTTAHPLNAATPHSMQISINEIAEDGSVELINSGFWGIHTVAGESYHLTFYLRSSPAFSGDVKVSLQSDSLGELTSHRFKITHADSWTKYEAEIIPSLTAPDARLILSFNGTGTVWIDFVSLFPANTFKGRRNGLRKDLAEFIAGLKPAFVRWPGGCFVEGINIESAPDWKNTIGPVEQRPGSFSPWGYWSGDGFGFHEYLQFCEDIHADALYVFNAGVSCEYRSGTFAPDDSLQIFIQNALDAIEYAIGPVTSTWGRVRAENGHPEPFPLKYVEVGNEQHGPRYAERYNIFYTAIKDRYPDMIVMASMGIGDVNDNTLGGMKKVDYVDEHAYKAAWWAMMNFDHFDKYERGQWYMYVGEYAANSGVGSGNMLAALSDAVYIMSMEKNGDLVHMSSYAPLLVNVNDVSWPVNLIHFDGARSFARIAYYVIKMFNKHRPSYNVTVSAEVKKEENNLPEFSGSIGLASWDTQVEYRDIKVVKGNKVLYEARESSRDDWQFIRGSWSVQQNTISQTAEGAQRLAWLPGKVFDAYTLTLKARKTGGLNAFIIPFAISDSSMQLRAHIGSWWNTHAMFEKVTDGFEVVSISSPKRIKPIELNRWYGIRLEVGLKEVKCYVDDELIMSYTQPPGFFSIAGIDEQSGDLIIKAVNASKEPVLTNFQIDGLSQSAAEGDITSISATAETDENSFAEPEKYTPVQKRIDNAGNNFTVKLAPLSVNVVRLRRVGR